MVAHHGVTAVAVDRRMDGLTRADGAGRNGRTVQENAAVVLHGIRHLQQRIAGFDRSGVARLSAAFRIERGAAEHHRDFVPGFRLLHTLAVTEQREHPGIGFELPVAEEFRLRDPFHQGGVPRPGIRVRPFPRGAGAFLLLEHQAPEFLFIHRQAVLGCDLLGQVDREAIGVAQAERVGARKHLAFG